jgi:hypothetical protein
MKRQRTKHKATFEERLVEEARRFKEAAEQQPPGSLARDLLLRRARQAETAAHISDWLSSPGLQPPASLSPDEATDCGGLSKIDHQILTKTVYSRPWPPKR